MLKVAVLQSNYIPWKGYFDIIHDVDLFIFYDDIQYTKRDWRNRNQLISPSGSTWLSVPVGADTNRLIVDVEILNHEWQKVHYNKLYEWYKKAPYFELIEPLLSDVYLHNMWDHLYELNRYFTVKICRDFLGIETKFADSRDYDPHGVKHEKLLSLVQQSGADIYISGPAAKDYIVAEDYARAGIQLQWKDYSGYPEYSQDSDGFMHNVSIIDLLANTGREASWYIWGWRNAQGQQ